MELPASEIDALMRKPGVRDVVSCLVGRSHFMGCLELAQKVERSVEEIESACVSLYRLRLLDIETVLLPENAPLPGALSGAPEVVPSSAFRISADSRVSALIQSALHKAELELVSERMKVTRWLASEKIRAIDSLAGEIFFARDEVRRKARGE